MKAAIRMEAAVLEAATGEQAGRNLSDKNYGSYLKANRELRGFSAFQLSKGLCAKSLVSELEEGKKSASRLLRERLLRRGGVSSEAYESCLGYEDSKEWKIQEKILDALETRDTLDLKKRLAEYAGEYGLKKNILKIDSPFREGQEGTAERTGSGEESGLAEKTESGEKPGRTHKTACCEKSGMAQRTAGGEKPRLEEKGKKGQKKRTEDITKRLRLQFYLGMLGMCRKLEGAGAEELTRIFDMAMRQSIPEVHEKPLSGLVLCAEEINLVLEYARCLPRDGAIRQCRELEQYLQRVRIEDEARVLNHPKVLYVLGQLLLNQRGAGIQECEEVIRLCDRGIELLRKTKRIYYLWELFRTKEAAVERKGELDPSKQNWVQYMRKEMEQWTLPFAYLYERFGIEKEQGSDVYLYRGQDNFDAGDVIRARRKMFGLTQLQFQEKITCTLETLQNMERKKCTTQPFYVQEMCMQLGLSPVCERTELMAASAQARILEKEIRYGANSGQFKENLEQIEKLKAMVDMSNPINRQWVLRTEGMARYREGLIGQEEYEELVKQSLLCTLPMAVMEYPEGKECYLTNSEMECIYHYALLAGNENPQEAYRRMKVVFRLEEEFENAGREVNHIRTYELYMIYKAKLLCGLGEYDKSKHLAEKIIRMCLQMGRVNIVDGALYKWIRNHLKICGKAAEPESKNFDWQKGLECCLALSRFCHNNVEESFYRKVIEDIVEKQD